MYSGNAECTHLRLVSKSATLFFIIFFMGLPYKRKWLRNSNKSVVKPDYSYYVTVGNGCMLLKGCNSSNPFEEGTVYRNSTFWINKG